MNRFTKATLLLFFFSLCGVAFLITARLRDHVVAPAPHELFAVVNDQLAAFRADDFTSAYRQASTGVQHKFTLPQFEAMVRRNYAEMANAQRVEFGSVRTEGSTALVQVFFFAGDGSARVFLYSLIAEDGGWKVGGVEEISRFRPNQQVTGTYVSRDIAFNGRL
ncbi:MAG: DUF4864 domain-containing protein [Chthoniobacterales bacterium]